MRQEDEDGQETGRKQQEGGIDRNAAGCGRRTKTDRKPGESSRKTELTGMQQDAAGGRRRTGNREKPAGNRKKRKEIKRGLQLREIYYRSCSLCRDFMKYCFNTLTV